MRPSNDSRSIGLLYSSLMRDGLAPTRPSDGDVLTSRGGLTVVKRETRPERNSPPFAPLSPAGAISSYAALSASGPVGVSVTTVSLFLHSNEVVTSPDHENASLTPGSLSARSTRPASTEARSIGWLNATTKGPPGSTNDVRSPGRNHVIAGWKAENLHSKSASRTPSAAEVSPAGIRTRYSVLGRRSVGMKR